MAITVGAVEFDVDADGSGFERQLRRIAKSAGASSGKALNTEFSKQLSSLGEIQLERMRERMVKQGTKSGRLLGRTVRQAMTGEIKGRLNGIVSEIAKVFTFDNGAFENWRKGFATVDDAVSAMAEKLSIANSEGRISNREFDALADKLAEYAESSREVEAVENERVKTLARVSKGMRDLHESMGSSGAFNRYVSQMGNVDKATRNLHESIRTLEHEGGDAEWAVRARVRLNDLNDSFRRLNADMDASGNKVRSLSDAWKGLGHNTKQWSLIIGAVLAGMQQIAVLGSAAGAGLLILGGAATGALVGVGALVGAFVRLAGDMEKVPDAIKPAAEAFQDLKTPLNELLDFLSIRAFTGTEGAFKSLGDTIRKLTPAFGPLGDAINRLVTGFADWSASAEGISLLSGLIEKSAPIFERVMGIVGKLGKALLIAFNNPKFQKAIGDMLTGIEGLFDTFTEFVSSDDFGVWIEETSSVMGKLGDLLGATSDMIDDLVTPEAYERTRQFLDNLTDFMPHLTNMLDILGRLDIFGIIAEALVSLGDALEPLAGPFKDIADALNDIIMIAIDEWGDQLKPVAEALAPFVQGLADMLKRIPASTVRDLASALGILAGGLILFNTVKWAANVTGIAGFFGSLKAGNGIVTSFNTSKLRGIAKGLGAFALIGAAQLIPKSFWEQFDIESNLPNNVLTGAGFGLMFGLWGAVIGAGIGLVVSLLTDFEGTFNDIGANLLTSMSNSGPFGQVGVLMAQFFAGLIPEEWATSDNPLEQFVAGLGFLVTDTGTAITIILEQLGLWWKGLTDGATTAVSEFLATWNGFWGNVDNPALWEAIGAKVLAWLASLYAGFQAKLGEIANNWTIFWNNLPTIVEGAYKKVTSFATAMFVALKVQFQTGLNGALGSWNAFWAGLPNAVQGAVNRVTSLVSGLMAAVQRALGGVGSLSRAAGGTIGGNSGGSFASGGVLSGPRRILAGEAGPEAIVPLRRPLSQVDPSVRWLSALAQGRTPAMASGGVVGGGKQVTVEAGAIVVDGARDPLATGVEVLNRLSENLI